MENREIVFRGVTASEPHRFVEGFVYQGIPETDLTYIIPKEIYNGYEVEDRSWFTLRFEKYEEVVPGTIGQFTGLLDKNGTKIFEGDKVFGRYTTDMKEEEHFVIWNEWCFTVRNQERGFACSPNEAKQLEVIGTIHDQLLEANNE